MDIIFLIGRILFGGYFLMMGVRHFMKMGSMKGYAASKGVASPSLAVSLSGLLLFLGGLGVITNQYVDIALILLVAFLIPTTFVMHKFWTVPEEQKMTEMTDFLKNMALLGAVIMMLSLLR